MLKVNLKCVRAEKRGGTQRPISGIYDDGVFVQITGSK